MKAGSVVNESEIEAMDPGSKPPCTVIWSRSKATLLISTIDYIRKQVEAFNV